MKIGRVLVCLLLTSCSIYRQQFDCPPDPGVPCTSVIDLEQMVVETPKGPDIFLGGVECSDAQGCRRRLWIPTKVCRDGRVISGHYISLN